MPSKRLEGGRVRIQQRKIKAPCPKSCRKKCFQKACFTDEIHQDIFNKYWSMGKIEERWRYIAKNFVSFDKK